MTSPITPDGEYQPQWCVASHTTDRLEARTEAFVRQVRQTMAGLKRFGGPPSAVLDAWLNLLHKESQHDWLIESLYIASAEYCAELATRSYEAEERVSAAFLDDQERRFRELLNSGPDLYAIKLGIPDAQTAELQAKLPAPTETDLPTNRKGCLPEAPALDERRAAYDAYKRKCKKAGLKMTEKELARLANPAWNTRDPVTKWKQGKDRPGDDRRIRRAMEKVPPASHS